MYFSSFHLFDATEIFKSKRRNVFMSSFDLYFKYGKFRSHCANKRKKITSMLRIYKEILLMFLSYGSSKNGITHPTRT